MKLKEFLIGILMLTLFLGMIGNLANNMQQNYPSNNQSNQTTQFYNKMSNATSSINSNIESLKGAINALTSSSSIGSKIIGGAYMLALVPILAVDIILAGTKISFLIPEVALVFGVPSYIVYLFVLIFWVSLIFAIVTFLWRFKE